MAQVPFWQWQCRQLFEKRCQFVSGCMEEVGAYECFTSLNHSPTSPLTHIKPQYVKCCVGETESTP